MIIVGLRNFPLSHSLLSDGSDVTLLPVLPEDDATFRVDAVVAH